MQNRSPSLLFIGLVAGGICVLTAGAAAPTRSVPGSVIDELAGPRPRLVIDRSLVDSWRDGALESEPLAAWSSGVRREAEEILRQPVVTYPDAPASILETGSRVVLERTYTLAFTFLVFGDPRFADRLWAELQQASELESWRPNAQFLDTAEMMHAFAIAYDWLYETWTPEQRAALRQTLVTHGLEAARDAYDGNLTSYAGWAAKNNWNFVCNASVITAVVALLPEERELGTELIEQAIGHLRPALDSFGQDGGWIEGPSYWGYATRYVTLLLETLGPEAVAKLELLDQAPGVAQTGWFPIYLTGPTGRPFDFADAEDRPTRAPQLFDLARIFDEPEFARSQLNWATGTVGDIIALSSLTRVKPGTRPPLDRLFRGVGVVSMRSSWADPNANFFAMKAGSNGANHGHLDLGSFIFEALGHRWTHEIEKESYAAPGYFEVGPKSRRWSYYPSRAEGHNTLVLNPSPAPDQYFRAKSKVTSFETSPSDAFVTVNLTDAYAPAGARVWRGARLTDSRNRLFLRDEIKLKEAGEIVWTVHVRDAVELSEDERTATLAFENKRLRLRLTSPTAARFELLDAAPLVPIPDTTQRRNPGFKKLVVRVKDVTDAAISVWFEPIVAGVDPGYDTGTDFGPMADWVSLNSPASPLTALAVGEEAVSEFDPDIFTYTVELESPSVAVTTTPPGESLAIAAANPPDLPTALWAVPGTTSARYRVVLEKFVPRPAILGTVPGARRVTASGSSQEGHPPANAFDGSLTTRWSAEGKDCPLTIDLGSPRRIEELGVAYHQGSTRWSEFSVEGSEDGATWLPLLGRTRTSGLTVEIERFPTEAPGDFQFVRFHGHGNSVNDWNSVTEVVILPLSDEN